MQTPPVVKVLAGWLLGLMLTAAAFVGVVLFLNSGLYGPERQVEEYFSALREGDGEGALGLLNGSVPQANPALLDGPALAAGAAAVKDVEVQGAVPAGGDRVDVPVSYTIRGTEHTTTFPLEKTGTRWIFFPVWEFVPAMLPEVEVSVVNGTEATVNGERVALPEGRSRFASFYPVELEGHFSGKYLNAASRTLPVTARTAGTETLALATAATPELTKAVDGEIRAFLDKCAAQTVFQPTNCPFNFQTAQRLAGDISWSITKYPAIRIGPNDGKWVIAPLTGTARLDTRLQDLFSGAIEDVRAERPFEFSAKLTVTDSEVTVTPVVEY